jgi:transcriptional regulator with XRE-family HTH domain
VSEKPRPSLRQSVGPSPAARGLLLARLQTVPLLNMGEKQIAELIREVESDPLFQQILHPTRPDWKVVRFVPHPRTRLGDSFFELNENALRSDAPADVVGILERHKGVAERVKRMGRDRFERYFLRAEENMSPTEIAKECGLTPDQAEEVRSFLLDFSVNAEFFDPSGLRKEASSSGPTARIARLGRWEAPPGGALTLDLTSPHLARGRYGIDYDRFQDLLRRGPLSGDLKRRLRAIVHRLELVNWRQNALFRMLDLLGHLQEDYLRSHDSLKRRIITQREMARRISVAPSTVNRALQDRSVVLPWGEELLLEDLFCSRKTLCLDALDVLESRDERFGDRSDAELQARLKKDLGFAVPRRTVNTYRREIAARPGA